ncbi:MAG TPA: sugar ABC transporter permease [Thermomicrobiales bacterium]|jgi:multiple sugar transport system permease protein|nr:sugar ABC transporter permease [Thermomicrobiales bacterium]
MATMPVRRPGSPSKKSRNTAAREESRAGWIAVSPWIIGFLVLTLLPMGWSFYLAFTSYDVLSPPEWVGGRNFTNVFTNDPIFWKSVRNTFIYALMYVPIHLCTSFGIALLLHQATKGQSAFRTLMYLPAMTPAVATSYVWLSILNPNDGWVNRALRSLNLPAPLWTVDPAWTKPTIVLTSIWVLGGAMVIFLAALQGVPKDLYEAAKLDGANAWQRMWAVTIPILSPVILFNLTVSTIASLGVFTQGFIIFDSRGGPENSALFIMMYLYRRGFENFQMGYASAVAWVLFVIIVSVTILQFVLSRRYVHYDQA